MPRFVTTHIPTICLNFAIVEQLPHYSNPDYIVIDEKGYRLNVGVILVGPNKKLFWARRIGQLSWQFPQGGIRSNEALEEALYRELKEEVGLEKEDVEILAQSQRWLKYRLPNHLIRNYKKPRCIGQKQKWFLLRLLVPDQKIQLHQNDAPEFDSWCWIEYWRPLSDVIFFKASVYKQVLKEFEPIVSSLMI